MKSKVIDIADIVADTLSIAVKHWPRYEGGTVDRKQHLSASEASKCVRSLFMEKAAPEDYETDERSSWGFAERGNSAEAWLVTVLRQFFHASELQYAGDDQVSFVWGRLSGTPDGLIVLDHEAVLLEVKSIDPRARLHGKPRSAHEAQVKQNMGILKALGIKVDYALVVYLNANNYEEMQQFVVKPDPSLVRAHVAKADKLFSLVEKATPKNWLTLAASLPAEGLTNGSADCDYCPFVSECSQMQKTKGTTPAPSDPTAPGDFPQFLPKTIMRTLHRFADLKAERDGLAAQLDDLTNEIKTYMDSGNHQTLETPKVKAVLQQVAGRKTLDKKAVEAAGIDLSPYEKVGKPSLRLLVERLEDNS